eukprot:8784112-Alexandrium_andersonii.AAC.1
MSASLVGSEMCIRDSALLDPGGSGWGQSAYRTVRESIPTASGGSGTLGWTGPSASGEGGRFYVASRTH